MVTFTFVTILVFAIFAFNYVMVAEIPKRFTLICRFDFVVTILVVSAFFGITLENSIKNENKMDLNSDLPDNMYYLGAEIWESKMENGKYFYEFGCPDSMEMPHDGITYVWESVSPLYVDFPYILTMDSMGTKEVEDDEIICVWRLMN